MAADNTTNQRNPFDSDDDDGLFRSRPYLDPITPDPPKPDPIPSTQFSQRVRTKAPATVLVCLNCETYYPDGGDWDYCPNCSAMVFEVSKD